MTISKDYRVSLAAICAAAFLLASPMLARAQSVTIGATDLGGTVTGANGPEAGVWVIAETTDLPTKFAKTVVTDDQGRYLIPELPKAKYKVWVRGYGLVDSPKVDGEPGKILDHKAVPAPNEKAAAEYYPGMYWYAMMNVPGTSEFPGTGEKGNGIPEVMKAQNYWLDTVKNSCQSCHAFGSKGIREIPEFFKKQSQGFRRGLGAAHAGRSGDEQHGAEPRPYRAGPRLQDLRRLDRSHREGRGAVIQAAASAGCRAQRRDYVVGLVDAEALHA